MQRTPAGLPFGMPGIGEEIDGAMQQAPHPGRQARTDMDRSDNKDKLRILPASRLRAGVLARFDLIIW
jgi:hypothetical protein